MNMINEVNVWGFFNREGPYAVNHTAQLWQRKVQDYFNVIQV